MDIKEVMNRAKREYKELTGNDLTLACDDNSLAARFEWEDIVERDERKQRIHSLAKEIDRRLPYFIPPEILPYVCSRGTGNYANPKYYNFSSRVDSWNEDFIYVIVPGALPFVITNFFRNDYTYLYEDVKYILPLCYDRMGIWKWQTQEETSWLPQDKNDTNTIWAVIGYCIDVGNNAKNSSPECKEEEE